MTVKLVMKNACEGARGRERDDAGLRRDGGANARRNCPFRRHRLELMAGCSERGNTPTGTPGSARYP
jgi:hypothetical protein